MTRPLFHLRRSGSRFPARTLALLAMACAAALGESFESLPSGPLEEAKTSPGKWSAAPGQAMIQTGHTRSGRQSLRLPGGDDCSITLSLTEPAAAATALSFHAERWTKRGPFRFRIEAKEQGSWKEIRNADDIAVGGFDTEVRLEVPAGASEIRFRLTSPPDAGVMMDDVMLHRPGPARAVLVETVQPVCPAFIREDFNPVLGFRIVVEGSEGSVRLEGLELGFEGTTDLADIASFRIVTGSADPAADPGATVAEGKTTGGTISLTSGHEISSGEHWFWISPTLRETASLDHGIDASLFHVKVGGQVLEPAQPSPKGSQRIGHAVRLPGDDGSKSYRIPGLVQTKAGSLIAVYDIRYAHAGDLPADIDVGASRSTDRGQTWEKMRVAMDMGSDPEHGHDGVGDPAILVDPASGRIWIVALWSHGNRAWHGSGPGITPDETGQLVLSHSDDDGKTWSQPVNITAQVKDPAMRLFFNGPGAGIAMKDGTLVFAAQYRAADGTPWSTMISSKDHGETWQAGSGVKSDTTEAQVVELADGSVMINCRDNRGATRTVAVTEDLGKTWTLHPTDRKALRDPVCMGSLLSREGALWFSNPDATDGRHAMTLKLSTDDGMTWPQENARLYDSRGGFGYSCLAPVGDSHIGVIYEGKSTMYFLRLPVE